MRVVLVTVRCEAFVLGERHEESSSLRLQALVLLRTLLPLFVWREFARRRQRCAMYIDNSFATFRQVRITSYNHHPISLSGKRIFGNLAQVPSTDQLIERLGKEPLSAAY